MRNLMQPKIILIALLLVGSFALLTGTVLHGDDAPKPQGKLVTVREVSDGARVEIEDDREVAYAGIRAPTRSEPLFEPSKQRNAELVAGKTVRIRLDQLRNDHKGRLLAYVFAGSEFVNETLVREGLAYVRLADGNRRYAKELLQAQAEARRSKRGIWGEVSTDQVGEVLCDPKYGNMHRPDCGELSKIDPKRLTRLDASDAALDAGFAPCSKCLPLKD